MSSDFFICFSVLPFNVLRELLNFDKSLRPFMSEFSFLSDFLRPVTEKFPAVLFSNCVKRHIFHHAAPHIVLDVHFSPFIDHGILHDLIPFLGISTFQIWLFYDPGVVIFNTFQWLYICAKIRRLRATVAIKLSPRLTDAHNINQIYILPFMLYRMGN